MLIFCKIILLSIFFVFSFIIKIKEKLIYIIYIEVISILFFVFLLLFSLKFGDGILFSFSLISMVFAASEVVVFCITYIFLKLYCYNIC